MKDIVINENGSFVRANYGFTMTTNNTDWIMQKIRIKLRTFLGEWFLDTSVGIPFFEILEKNPNTKLLEAIFKQKILEVAGVAEIVSFSLDYSGTTRTVKPVFSVKLQNGELIGGTI
jgi:hypothetical protein